MLFLQTSYSICLDGFPMCLCEGSLYLHSDINISAPVSSSRSHKSNLTKANSNYIGLRAEVNIFISHVHEDLFLCVHFQNLITGQKNDDCVRLISPTTLHFRLSPEILPHSICYLSVILFAFSSLGQSKVNQVQSLAVRKFDQQGPRSTTATSKTGRTTIWIF